MVDYLKSLSGGHHDEQRIEDAEQALADVGKKTAADTPPKKPAPPIKNEKNPGNKK